MQGVSVRRAGPADAASISALLLEFNGEALPPEILGQRMVAVGGSETVFLAEQATKAVGLLVLRIVPTFSEPRDWTEITEMYVSEGARRQGVGRTLVEIALDYAQGLGCTEVHLLVDPANKPALAFYRALGFWQDSWEMRRRL